MQARPQQLLITVTASRPLACQTQALGKPLRLIVTLTNAVLDGAGQEVPTSCALVERLRTEQTATTPPTVRLELLLRSDVRCEPRFSDDKRRLTLVVVPLEAPRAATEAASVAAARLLASNALPALVIEPSRPPRERKISILFLDATVADIMAGVALQANVDVVVVSDLPTKRNIRLRDRSPEEAVEIICRAFGLAFRKELNTFIVGKREDVEVAVVPKPRELQAVTIRFADPGEIERMLTTQFTGLKVSAIKGSGLVISGERDEVRRGVELATTLDREPPALKPPPAPPLPEPVTETKRIQHISVEVLTRHLAAAYPRIKLTVTRDEATQVAALTLNGQPADVARALIAITELDQARPAAARTPEPEVTEVIPVSYAEVQLIQAALTQLFGNELKVAYTSENQVQGGGAGAGGGSGGGGGAGAGGGAGGGGAGASSTGGAGGGSLTLTTGTSTPRNLIALSAARSVVERARHVIATIDTAPPLVRIETSVTDVSPEAINNLGLQWNFGGFSLNEIKALQGGGQGLQFGSFDRTGLSFSSVISALVQKNLAKIIARPNLSTVSGKPAGVLIGDRVPFQTVILQGGTAIPNVQFIEAGVILTVTPRVNGEGVLTLEVRTEVSTFTGFSPAGFPQVSTRSAQTTVRVKDGETIAIAGLLRDEELKTTIKVPGLGDLPVLGALFRSRQTRKRHSEIMVFVTPRIVN